jgi:protein O-GlcNAc transferase
MSVSKFSTWGIALLIIFMVAVRAICQEPQPGHEVTADGILARSMTEPLRTKVEQAIKSRDYKTAEELLIHEINSRPRSHGLLTVLGGVFFLDGKYLNSAIAYKKAESIAPLDARSRFTLAMSYVILGRRDWARSEFEKLESADPQNFLYPYWLSRLDYDAMHYDKAISEVQKAIQLNPGFVNAYENLGLCLEALAKYDEAVQAFRQGMRLNRHEFCSPWPGLNLGALLIKMDQFDEAAAALEDSLHCDSRFPDAYYQLGLMLEKQGKDKEAMPQLQHAILLKPSFAAPYYALGRLYHRLGDDDKANQAFLMFEKLSKGRPMSSIN